MKRFATSIAAIGLCFVGGATVRAQEVQGTTPPAPAAQKNVKCAPTGRCEQARVHFGFDSAVLDDEAKGVLDRSATCLMTNQNVKILIEGSADKRGTEEYNKILGQRRADAVAEYLKSKGVSDTQVATNSVGKDRPLCGGQTEDCFAQNRNATLSMETPVAQR